MINLTPARERSTLLVLAAVQFTHVMDFMIMMPLGPQLMESLSIGTEAFGHLVASYGISAGLCGILATFFMDRFDRKRALLVLYTGFGLATLGCALAQTYPALLIARVFAGAFGGVTGSVVTAMVGDIIPQERRGRGMAFVMSAFALAQIGGVPAGLWFAARSNWHLPFAMLVGVATIVAPTALIVLPRVDEHVAARGGGKSGFERAREILSEPNHLRAFALVAMITISGMIMIPFLATALVRNGGISQESLTLVYGFGGAATLFSNNWLGRLGDRIGHVRVFNGVLLFSLPPVIALAFVGAWPIAAILLVTTLFMVSMGGRWTPTMALVTMSVEGRLRGGFMSLSSAIQAGFAAVGTGLASAIVSEETPGGRLDGFATASLVSLAFLAVGAVLIRRIKVVDSAAIPRPPAAESGMAD